MKTLPIHPFQYLSLVRYKGLKSVLKNYLTVPPGAEVAFEHGNKRFREGLKDLQSQGIKNP